MTDPEKPKSLYLAFTPYHLLLTLIHEDRTENDFVIMVDDHGKLKNYEVAGSKFLSNYRYVNMRSSECKLLSRQLVLPAGNRKKIDSIVKPLIFEPIGNIYVFNDTIPAAQYIIKKLKHNNAKIKVTYIEDGSAPYNEHYIEWSALHRIKCIIAYGLSYQFVKVLGTSPIVDGSLFLNPHLVRVENKIKPHQKLSIKENYLDQINRMTRALSSCSISKPEICRNSALFLLPRLMTMPEKFILELSYAIEKLGDQGWFICLKSHPLDGNSYEKLSLKTNCQILPGNLPAELAPTIISDLKAVIGKETTSLLAIKSLFPEISIINLIEDCATTTQYQSAMLKAGVSMCTPENLELDLGGFWKC